MKQFQNILFLLFFSVVSLNADFNYNSVGVRDPMIRTVRKKIEKKAEKKKEAIIRQREIYNIINKYKIYTKTSNNRNN